MASRSAPDSVSPKERAAARNRAAAPGFTLAFKVTVRACPSGSGCLPFMWHTICPEPFMWHTYWGLRRVSVPRCTLPTARLRAVPLPLPHPDRLLHRVSALRAVVGLPQRVHHLPRPAHQSPPSSRTSFLRSRESNHRMYSPLVSDPRLRSRSSASPRVNLTATTTGRPPAALAGLATTPPESTSIPPISVNETMLRWDTGAELPSGVSCATRGGTGGPGRFGVRTGVTDTPCPS